MSKQTKAIPKSSVLCGTCVFVHACVNGVSSVDRREIMTQALIILCLDVLTGAQARCQRAGLVSFITENQEEERGEHGAGGGE